MSSVFKTPVHIEAAIKPECSHANSVLIPVFAEWIKKKCAVFQNGPIKLDDEIASVISSIKVADLPPNRRVSFWQADVCLHLYRLCDQGPEEDFLEGEEELPAAEQWELPNALLNNLWDSIIIDAAVKNRLLSYCSTSIQFSEARVDTDIISWNRMILLHGPPGTGKTTICKGLAQKTFVRNSDRFSSGMLLEINSHSLFSKWFSESGKLVMKLFAHIGEIADDEECMVVVLIDEVESITASRSSNARSNEPGDAVRVVNAVLTSLDALKRRPNVLVLCTSNLIGSVDAAFLDRVDLKVHLGPPPISARYDILRSCCVELMHRGLITPVQPLSQDCLAIEQQLKEMKLVESSLPEFIAGVLVPDMAAMMIDSEDENESMRSEITEEGGTALHLGLREDQYLYVIAAQCEGMSGRSLRKLPIKAHSYYLQRPRATLMDFLLALHGTIKTEAVERAAVSSFEAMAVAT